MTFLDGLLLGLLGGGCIGCLLGLGMEKQRAMKRGPRP